MGGLDDEPESIAASVQQRLKNRAREMKAEYGLVLQRYATERFLYRLGVSSEVDRFTLKGAALFLVWAGNEFRATRDVDLLGSGAEDHTAIREAMATICAIDDPQAALRFHADAIHIEEIRHKQSYGGARAKLGAGLGKTKIALRVDIGFGDTIHPGRQQAEYPTLLGGAVPRVWAYPRETVIAEKFEAMVSLGTINSRMKDFWDVAAISQEFPFDGATLRTAIDGTFRRRGTPIGEEVPEALRPAFYEDEKRVEMWRVFQQKSGLQLEVPAAFAAIGERVITFLGPVRDSLAGGGDFAQVWAKGGPWLTVHGQSTGGERS